MVNKPILDRFEEKTIKLGFKHNVPSMTVLAYPILHPDAPLISKLDIYELYENKIHSRRVMGGVCYSLENLENPNSYNELTELCEFNEYGIACRKKKLPLYEENQMYLSNLIENTKKLIQDASKLYEKCEVIEIEVSVLLKQVCGITLLESEEHFRMNYRGLTLCLDSDILISKKCFSEELGNLDKQKDIIEYLTLQMMWPFNFPIHIEELGERVRNKISV